MYSEDELIHLSEIQHISFCERQWGLIHLEHVWEENMLTAQGRNLHERAHEAPSETRGDVRIARGLRIRSLGLGLSGIADVVEFHKTDKDEVPENQLVKLPGRSGLWKPFPIEYKRGRPKILSCDEVQLCAQAICLEEMMDCFIPEGALYYGKTKRRHDVRFDDALRNLTEELAGRLHELSRTGITPPPEYGKKCQSCSLMNVCMPEAVSKNKSVERYINNAIKNPEEWS